MLPTSRRPADDGTDQRTDGKASHHVLHTAVNLRANAHYCVAQVGRGRCFALRAGTDQHGALASVGVVSVSRTNSGAE